MKPDTQLSVLVFQAIMAATNLGAAGGYGGETTDPAALAKPGGNHIEMPDRDTLADHCTTVPTRCPGDTTSGLPGPVTLEFSEGDKVMSRKEESK